jgi:hypothetical protein
VEQARSGEAGRAHHRDAVVGHEGALQHRVLARGGAHPERVPRLLDRVAVGVAVEEAVHDLRVRRVARVQPMDAEVVPDRRQAAKNLVARESPAALDPLGLGRGHEQRHVVAGLAVARGEHAPRGGLLEHPGAALVARPVQVRGDARPVQVHVDRDRRGRRDVREPALQPGHLGERQAGAAEGGGDGDVQVARGLQLVEVLLEEAVVAVVLRGPGVEAGEHRVGEHGRGGDGAQWNLRSKMAPGGTPGAARLFPPATETTETTDATASVTRGR